MGIKRCKETYITQLDGGFHTVHEGELVEDSSPLYKANKHLYEDLALAPMHVANPSVGSIEAATAEPGEKRSVTTAKHEAKSEPPRMTKK